MNIIIILGHKLDDDNNLSIEGIGRMNIGIKLFFQLDDCIFLLSGGVTNNKGISESEIMKKYALKKGIDKKYLLKEEKSLDTIGNGFFTREIINDIDNIEKIYVISSCYHMNRVSYIFRNCYNTYDLNFDNCFNTQISKEIVDHEEQSLHLSKNFFKNIKPGDINEISNRLFNNHNLY